MVGTIYRTGHVWVATKRAGFIFIGYGIRKEGVTIYAGIIRRSKFKNKERGVLGLQNTVRFVRRDHLLRRVEPSTRIQGGTARGKKGEGSNLECRQRLR